MKDGGTFLNSSVVPATDDLPAFDKHGADRNAFFTKTFPCFLDCFPHQSDVFTVHRHRLWEMTVVNQ